jgi:hypothetical protein
VPALAAYRAGVRDVVYRAVVARGFGGGSEDWHVVGASGDHGMIGLQRNRLPGGDIAFRVHLAVTPGPWWGYLGQAGMPRTTHGLWREVLPPTRQWIVHRDESWWHVSDDVSARVCGAYVVAGLHNSGFEQIERLLRRPALIETIRRADLGRRRPYPHALLQELLLLAADEGAEDDFLRTAAELRTASPRHEGFIAYARRGLESRRQDPGRAPVWQPYHPPRAPLSGGPEHEFE